MRRPLILNARSRIDPASIEKILLIRLRRIGDVVMTTPSVRALRERFPDAEIAYLVEEPYRELVEQNPDLDEVIVFPRRLPVAEFRRRLKPIRDKRYDLLIDFHGGPRALWVSIFSRARIKIGHRLKYKHVFYHITLPRTLDTGPVHSVENHFSLARAAGVEMGEIPAVWMPPASPEEGARIESLFRQNDWGERRIIVLHIGAGNRFRDWGLDNLRCLISKLRNVPETVTILIGGPEDSVRAQALLPAPETSVFSCVGRLNLREVREIISRAAVFLGPDSGPMHIAATTDTPIVAYFGPTLPAHFAPWRAEAMRLEKPFACRPCRQRKCTFKDFRCLLTISPEEVFKAVLHTARLPASFNTPTRS